MKILNKMLNFLTVQNIIYSIICIIILMGNSPSSFASNEEERADVIRCNRTGIRADASSINKELDLNEGCYCNTAAFNLYNQAKQAMHRYKHTEGSLILLIDSHEAGHPFAF